MHISDRFMKFFTRHPAILLLMLAIFVVAASTGCTEEQKTGTSAAAITATGLSPVTVTCDESGACVVNVDIDEHGHINLHDYVDFPGDDGEDWWVSYLPTDDGCDISNNWGKICSKKTGQCPKGKQMWCKVKTCIEDHGGISLPRKTQVDCRNCTGGVNPNTSTNGCSPV